MVFGIGCLGYGVWDRVFRLRCLEYGMVLGWVYHFCMEDMFCQRIDLTAVMFMYMFK